MRCLRETVKSLFKSLSASMQLRLRLVILGVAFYVDFITPSGEILGREFGSYGTEN